MPASFIGGIVSCLGLMSAAAAVDIWNGGGTDGKWQTPGNWGGTPPSPGDALVFQGDVRPINTNTFSGNTVFDGITFASPAAAFNLYGNQISLTNDIVDNKVVVSESVLLPISLDATHNLNVITNGILTMSNVISGAAGAGITLPGGGRVILGAANTFKTDTGTLATDAGSIGSI